MGSGGAHPRLTASFAPQDQLALSAFGIPQQMYYVPPGGGALSLMAPLSAQACGPFFSLHLLHIHAHPSPLPLPEEPSAKRPRSRPGLLPRLPSGLLPGSAAHPLARLKRLCPSHP